MKLVHECTFFKTFLGHILVNLRQIDNYANIKVRIWE